MPKVGFEPNFYPCKQREVANYREDTSQHNAVRASPEGKVFPVGTHQIRRFQPRLSSPLRWSLRSATPLVSCTMAKPYRIRTVDHALGSRVTSHLLFVVFDLYSRGTGATTIATVFPLFCLQTGRFQVAPSKSPVILLAAIGIPPILTPPLLDEQD